MACRSFRPGRKRGPTLAQESGTLLVRPSIRTAIWPAASGLAGMTAVPSLPLRWAAAARPAIRTRVPVGTARRAACRGSPGPAGGHGRRRAGRAGQPQCEPAGPQCQRSTPPPSLDCPKAPSLVGGKTVPPRGLGVVLRDPRTIVVHRPEVNLPAGAPWSAARRYHRAASVWSCGTPVPA